MSKKRESTRGQDFIPECEYDIHTRDRLKNLAGCIEATLLEMEWVRDKYKEYGRTPAKWEELDTLHFQVGAFHKIPVAMTLRFVKIGQDEVVFWEGCSLVVHHGMCEAVFDRMCPQLGPRPDGFTNALNWSNVINNLEDMRLQRLLREGCFG